jgi:hypothetical protein
METIMTKRAPTLEERIDVALQPDTSITSANLAALIEETETEIAKAGQGWRVEQTGSRDPGAKHQAMMAILAANRLPPLLPKLQARYEQLHEQEQAAAWLAEREAAWLTEHDTLKRERDSLAAELRELREVHADVARKTANLFGRITINNEALAELHQARPPGMEQHLRSAELHARGLDSFSRDTPSLLTAVHLVDWDTGHQIWPPPPPSMAAAFAAIAMPAYDRRFTGDWAKDNERRAAGQRAEQQRMADYYVRAKKEQEERENAEARELFLEQQQRLTVNRPIKP